MSNLVIIFSPHMLTLLVNYKITEGSLCHKCHAVLTICFAHYNRHNCLLNELITQSHSCCFCIISTFLWSIDKSYQFRWAKKEPYYRGTDNNELMWMICRKKIVVYPKKESGKMGHPPYLLRWIVWESLYLEKIQKEYDFLTDQGSMGHHPTRLCIEPE